MSAPTAAASPQGDPEAEALALRDALAHAQESARAAWDRVARMEVVVQQALDDATAAHRRCEMLEQRLAAVEAEAATYRASLRPQLRAVGRLSARRLLRRSG
ncbi:MAG TPA: hypothetical protein VHC41_06550 [Mycobacteriales bacterium]|nr:hypothetical protein [Mycobacteriales bacterium]